VEAWDQKERWVGVVRGIDGFTTNVHGIDPHIHLNSNNHIYLWANRIYIFQIKAYLSGHDGGVGDSGAQRHGRDGAGGNGEAADAGVEEHWGRVEEGVTVYLAGGAHRTLFPGPQLGDAVEER